MKLGQSWGAIKELHRNFFTKCLYQMCSINHDHLKPVFDFFIMLLFFFVYLFQTVQIIFRKKGV